MSIEMENAEYKWYRLTRHRVDAERGENSKDREDEAGHDVQYDLTESKGR